MAPRNSVGHGIACFDTSKYRTRFALHPLVIDIDTERKVQQVYNKYTSTHDECTASVSSQSGLLSARFPAIYLLGYFVVLQQYVSCPVLEIPLYQVLCTYIRVLCIVPVQATQTLKLACSTEPIRTAGHMLTSPNGTRPESSGLVVCC